MNEISRQFDQIIQSHPRKAVDAMSFYTAEMERRDCMFGDDVIPSFLRPVFVSPYQVEELNAVLGHIMSVLEKVTRLYFTDPELREYFYIEPKAAELLEIDHGYNRNIVISRPDAFLTAESLRFVEFNCDSPAGPGFSDVQEEILREAFPLSDMRDTVTFGSIQRRKMLLKALLDCFQEFAGKTAEPRIAIIDWKEVKTVNEFCVLKKYFEEQGVATTIADPRELKFVNGRLEHNGFPINLIYRRAIFRELMERYDEVQDFIKAYKAGKVCVVNPFRSRLASIKAVLAIVTNSKRFRHLFTDEENKVIKRHVPWTRRVLDKETTIDGKEVSLINHVITHRENLVLKPTDSYGGKDVLIGRETGQDEWEALIKRIALDRQDWVVQRFVDITRIRVPVEDSGGINYVEKKFNINPFVFNGEYAGSIARYSDKSVINVSAGGGLVPVIACEEKE